MDEHQEHADPIRKDSICKTFVGVLHKLYFSTLVQVNVTLLTYPFYENIFILKSVIR
jgi:hypothetical protein